MKERWVSIKNSFIILLGLILYIACVSFFIYELNKENDYSPPAYLQDMTFDKENEVKLNDIGYKIENIKKSKKSMIITLRVANYRNADVTLKYNKFALTNNIDTQKPKSKISEELNESVDNMNNQIIANIKANNVKEIHLVFNLNKNFMQAKDMLLNVYSEPKFDNQISIIL
ncbi:hypothetical protein ACU40P_04175 [Staphylococcus arlettae]|uniref:hypothetical protein n=1 Tax=Staphylococcus arlettae TaxID=29378 RepID=UPI00113F72E6|nr:hypothetical protein [Staphylococcus arlettae]MCD9054367.1 hypothetical protein [Staphylococcus arlettae]MDT3894902.1 hypothetical protein [Staphylococcus arlettae]BBK28307.1 hypothetical protein SAP2_14910 [Staphylococcus arlettae]